MTTVIRDKRHVIAFVESSFQGTIGGSHHSLYYLVQALDSQRYRAVVVFYEDNAMRQRFEQLGAQVVVLAEPRGVRLIAPLPVLLKSLNVIRKPVNSLVNFIAATLRPMVARHRWIRQQRIDLVHLNNNPFDGDWVLACRLLGIPCVAHQRGLPQQLDRLQLRLAAAVDQVFCISRAVYDSMATCGCNTGNLTLLHNGIDPDALPVSKDAGQVKQELAITGSAQVVGMVGNIKPWKGQLILLEALIKLRDRYPDLYCVFVGEAAQEHRPYQQSLEQLLKVHDVAGQVRFTGYTDRVPDYVSIMDVVVHGSVEPEPFGRVIIEGMALAKPVIGSRAGGVPEIIKEPECGLTFEPGNAQDLAEKLDSLLSDPVVSNTMGLAARQRVRDHFHVTENARQTMAWYQQLLGTPPE